MSIKQWVNKITALKGRNWLDIFLAVIFAAAIITVIKLNFSVNADDGNWDDFRVEHHCQLQKSAYGVQKASWLCDDGNVYYRWRQQR